MPRTDFGVLSALANQEADLSSREKLIRSAEALFSAKGFRDVSVREIAAHAGVNSALVGYYFRGKQALFNEVYRMHAAPLAKERMKRLTALIQSTRKPEVEDILKAWLIPWMQADQNLPEGSVHLRFSINLSRERWEYTDKAAPFVQRSHNAFVNALHDCLPYLSRATIMWRLHFMIGAIAFGDRAQNVLQAISKGECDAADLNKVLDQILPFAAAGFCAPEPECSNSQV